MQRQSIAITTASPIENLTRLAHFYRDSTNGFSRFNPSLRYYSDGITRQCELACVIQYTLYGVGETWVGNERFAVPEKHALINIINQVDTGYCYPRDGEGEWGFISFNLLGGNIRGLFSELIKKYGPVYDLSAAHETLTALAENIERRGEEIYTVSESGSIGSRLITMLLESVESDSRTPTDMLINRIHRIIARRVREPDSICFGVVELAREVGMSREHLSRIYHEVVGETLKSRIDEKRLEYIYELLAQRGCSCSETARLIGIGHPANLTSYVKRLTGMTPTELCARRSAAGIR